MLVLLATLGCVVATLAAPSAESDSSAKGQIWAVLVAGSNGWYNYGQQADICHAYQILHGNGVPDSNIIVMMYDDIAYNKNNTNQGVVINRPDGPNVYKNVLKDYTKKDVIPENFLHVLTGNKTAMQGKGSGKVLESGPNDKVFVYFSDHGGPGKLFFRDHVLYKDDLFHALKTMHENKMYKKLVFYIEACYSGSMFSTLPLADMNIFAITSTNPEEPGHMCEVDSQLDTPIADEFAFAWTTDVESREHLKTFSKETLLEQYQFAYRLLSRFPEHQSHPQIYGDKTIGNDKVMDYIGDSKNTNYHKSSFTCEERVPRIDVELYIIKKKIEKTSDISEKAELTHQLDTLLQGRRSVDELFSRILEKITGIDQESIVEYHRPLTLEVMPCYKTVVNFFSSNCVSIYENTYVITHLHKLANLCAEEVPSEDIVRVLAEECAGQNMTMTRLL